MTGRDSVRRSGRRKPSRLVPIKGDPLILSELKDVGGVLRAIRRVESNSTIRGKKRELAAVGNGNIQRRLPRMDSVPRGR